METVKELLTQLVDVQDLGPLGLSGAGLMLLLRLYRLPQTSSLLTTLGMQRARWEGLPSLAKFSIPFLLSLAGGFLVAVAGGAPALSALSLVAPKAVTVALEAVGLHHLTKLFGQFWHSSALKKDPYYDPGKARQMMSVLLPLLKVPPSAFDTKP